ncbi:7TM-DISM domain-containing protein [Spirosoma sp. KNUC1025]|uniref:7TM-DISM domain-containing protein n=1 Tax=Spirosoma sp. KNUC1025 TaxID=2894082 RepID=UPI00386D0571|nr:7TM-DISM domain-containing protein [Spirosoma sp. KNUC1025]
MRWYLFLGILLSEVVAFAQQKQPMSPDKTAKPVARQYDGQRAVKPSGTYRPQSPVQQETLPRRLSTYQPGHLIQMPESRQATMPVLIFFSTALGAFLFMSLFTFAQYLLNRDAPYGWYALYLLTTAAWLWQSTRVWLNGPPQPPDLTVFSAYMLLLKYGMIVSYIRFIGHLLEVPQQQPRLARWTHYFVWFSTLSVPFILTELFVWHSTYVSIGIDVLTYTGLLFLITRMLRNRHPLKRYVLMGFGLIVSGAMIATFLKYTSLPTTDQLVRMPMFYIAVTALLEILCFSLALGRRFQLNKEEKIQAQQQLIQQLEENGRLQKSHTLELKQQLAQRETDVLTKAHELEEQRISQLRSGF